MRSVLLVLGLLAASVAAVAEPIAAGTYKGKYEGSSGSAGEFRITLAKQGGDWTAEVTFTLGGQDVKCKVTSLKVEGATMRAVYSFDLQGNALESAIEGELKEGALTGKYRTQVPGDGTAVDEGVWTTTLGLRRGEGEAGGGPTFTVR